MRFTSWLAASVVEGLVIGVAVFSDERLAFAEAAATWLVSFAAISWATWRYVRSGG